MLLCYGVMGTVACPGSEVLQPKIRNSFLSLPSWSWCFSAFCQAVIGVEHLLYISQTLLSSTLKVHQWILSNAGSIGPRLRIASVKTKSFVILVAQILHLLVKLSGRDERADLQQRPTARIWRALRSSALKDEKKISWRCGNCLNTGARVKNTITVTSRKSTSRDSVRLFFSLWHELKNQQQHKEQNTLFPCFIHLLHISLKKKIHD